MFENELDAKKKALKVLHDHGHTQASPTEVDAIFENYHKHGPGPHFPPRIDKRTSGNPRVDAYLLEGSNGDGSVLLCIKDFAGNVVSKHIGKLRKGSPNGAPVEKALVEVLPSEEALLTFSLAFPLPKSREKIGRYVMDKVPLIERYSLGLGDRLFFHRVGAHEELILTLVEAQHLAYPLLPVSPFAYHHRYWDGECVVSRNKGHVRSHLGVVVWMGSPQVVFVTEGLTTALSGLIALKHTAFDKPYALVTSLSCENLRSCVQALRYALPESATIVVMREEGVREELLPEGVVFVDAMFPGRNCDWNDDVRQMITDGASAEEAYQKLGKHILDGLNSSLALKEEEKPEKEAEKPIEHEDFAPEIGASLNVSLLPHCMSKILSDVLAFKGMSQGVGLSSLLCFIGGVVGHRVKRSYCRELPFLYVCCIGGVGSGKSYRFNSLQNDVFNNKIHDFFDTEFVQTSVNKNLIEICENMYHHLFCSKQKPSNMSDEEEELNTFLDSIKKETSQNSLYNNRGELYVNRCLKDTYKQIFNNKLEIKNKSTAGDGALEIDHLASGFSALFLDQFSGNATNSLVMIKTLFLLCPSVCFYYDELSKFFEAEKSEALAVQREYILSMYESGGTKNSLSRGCANIKNYIDSTLFMIGNLTTGEFFSDLVRGKMFDKLNKKGFFGRTLLCEDKSPRKTTDQLYSERKKEACDKNEEAFSILAKTLIGIEDSFRNPVEFLAGHIRIPMEDENFLKRSISSVSYWSDLYSKEGSDYSEGSVGRALLENFIGRIHSVYNSIYALMFLLFAGEDFCMENSVDRFSSQDPFNINSTSSQNFMKLFNQRKGLHRFVTEQNVERASIAADEAFNFLMRNDFSVRAEVARRVNPYKSSDLECARAIYSRLEEGEMDWCRPIIIETPYMKISSHYVNTSKMASQCSWLNVPDKRGFYSAAIGKKNAIEDFFDRNSFLVKDFSISDSNSCIPVINRKSLGDLDEDELDFSGKIFLKIKRTSRKGHKVYTYIFNFFNRELVLEELCGRFSLPVTQIKPNGSRVVFIGKKGKENKRDDKKLTRKR